jgi:hypothetical protein
MRGPIGRSGFAPHDLVSYWKALNAPLSEDSQRRILAFDQRLLAEMVPDRIDNESRSVSLSLFDDLVTNDWRFDDMRRFAS